MKALMPQTGLGVFHYALVALCFYLYGNILYTKL